MKKLLLSRELESHLVDASKDYHTRHGVARKDGLQGTSVNVGSEEFFVIEPSFLDYYKRIRRHAQIITLKDLGSLIAHLGINKTSVVIESGSGSGAVSCFLGMIAKKVYSFDRDERSLEVTQYNVDSFALKNVVVKRADVYVDDLKIDADVAILDLPEPWRAKPVFESLKVGGMLAVYLPNISQVQQFVTAVSPDFVVLRTIEVIEREWAVDSQRSRPVTKDHSHTGFITFARRIR